MDRPYDYFISRAGADRTAATFIAEALEADGASTFLQDFDFGPSNFVGKMDTGLKDSGRVIALLSPDYLISPHCDVEWQAVVRDDPSNLRQRLVPFLVRPCQLEGLLALYAYIDLSEPLARGDLETVRTLVLARLAPERVADAEALLARYTRQQTAPFNSDEIRPVPGFTGREDALEKIDAALAASDAAEVVQTAGLSGLGGIGKTTLARHYGYTRRGRFGAVWWLDASTETNLIASLADLTRTLAPDQASGDEREAAFAALAQIIPARQRPVLLIYDNLEDRGLLERLGPREKARALITTRQPNLPIDQRIAIDVFTPDESRAYLRRQSGRDDIDDAALDRLAEGLGHLPLALSHAAAELSTNSLQTPDRFLARMDALLDRTREGVSYNPEQTVYATYRIAMETADAKAPGAAQLMGLMAQMAPARIPLELLEQDPALAAAPFRPLLGPGDEAGDRRFGALGALAQAALIEVAPSDAEGPEENTVSVHRLVQAAARSAGGPGDWLALISAVRLLNAAFPYVAFENWPRCRRLADHAGAATALAAADALPGIDTFTRAPGTPLPAPAPDWDADACAALARLANQAGYFLKELALHREAEPLYRRALAIAEASYGPDHPEVATDLNNLASLLQDTNRLAEAEPLCRRALDIDEASYGPDHPEVAISLNNLARLLQDTNRLAEAEPLYRRVVEIFEKSLGPDPPNVAIALNNLAGLLRATNRLAEAEPFFRCVVEIFEKSLGPDHPKVATGLNNLASLLQNTNRLAEAEPLFSRALAIDEASYGPDHPAVARDLNNLAALYFETGRFAEAEALIQRAFDIRLASLGPDHPDTQSSERGLAIIRQTLGKS